MARIRFIERIEELFTKSGSKSVLRYKAPDGKWRYVASTTEESGDVSPGTVTSVTVNGSNKTPTSGVVDLGTLSTPMAVVSVSGATPTQALSPNTFYKFMGSPTSFSGVTLATPTDNNVVNIYAFSFTAGADDVDPVSALTGVEWANGFEPDLSSGDYCEVTIMDGIATFIAHTPATTTEETT